MELIFEVRDADEGGFDAHALGHSIFTKAETWYELRANVIEAVARPRRRRPNPDPAAIRYNSVWWPVTPLIT